MWFRSPALALKTPDHGLLFYPLDVALLVANPDTVGDYPQLLAASGLENSA
jgi:hypothetical protein